MNHRILRKVARSTKWQLLYNKAKELAGSIKLFNNVLDLTKEQIWLLYYCELYSSLYTDIATNESYISEDVIVDDLRTDAYVLYRNEKRKKEFKNRLDNKNQESKSTGGIPRVIFRRKNK